MAKRKKKLPKGLAEFRGTIELDDKYTEELLRRLTDLPESNLAPEIVKWRETFEAAEKLEKEWRKVRMKARDMAVAIFDRCLEQWTVKELQEATGYDDE
jgi:hypothetical protein